MSDLLNQLRQACADVAAAARYVRINQEVIPGYAASLPLGDPPPPADETPPSTRDARAAFWLTLDAINFGSGWFPTLRKRAGHSGYHTVAAGIRERFATHGSWSPYELQAITAQEVAETLGQDADHELMQLFARSLADLGRQIEAAGGFTAVVDSAHGSAEALVERLAAWECFADTSAYAGLEVPFLKRAQIAAADLARAGVAQWTDLHRLTMFADNLVPHVLRLDGILAFDQSLVRRIDREELIEHGSHEEVEIRAGAVHAVELIAVARRGATSAEIDQLLWRRGQEPRYKARPRHRSRCTAY